MLFVAPQTLGLRLAMALVASGSLVQCSEAFAQQPQLFELTARVTKKPPIGGLSTQQQPVVGAFVYLPAIRYLRMPRYLSSERRTGFDAWLKAYVKSSPIVKQTHKFTILNQQIVPQRVLGSISDEWILPKTGMETLYMETLANSYISGYFGKQVSRTLSKAEPVPIAIKSVVGGVDPAYALVLDHPFACVTDETGKAKFKGLPVGVDMPFLIACPDCDSVQVSSPDESLFARGRRFTLSSEDSKAKLVDLTVECFQEDD